MLLKLIHGLALAALTALMVVTTLTMLDAILRFSGAVRVVGLHDVTEFIFAVVVASCFPVSLMRGSNITVRILSNIAGDRVGKLGTKFGHILTLAFFVYSSYGLSKIAINFDEAGRTTSTLDIALAPWVWATVLVFLLSACVQFMIVFGLNDIENPREVI